MEFRLDHTIEVLERTPRILSALLGGLSDAWLQGSEGPDTFSPRDVVGHLIHGEETDWIPRMRIILEHGPSRPFVPFDRFAFRQAIQGKTTEELLKTFGTLREKNLEYLKNARLGPEELGRTGTHPELGAVTLQQLLATWAVHDLGHIAQIVRVMAKQYGKEVGPWKEYISLLGKRV